MPKDSEQPSPTKNDCPADWFLPEPEPMPANIRSIQPGGGLFQSIELAWGRVRRGMLATLRPSYVRRMRRRIKGDPRTCPVEVVDSRDLKFFRNVTDCSFDPADDRFAWRDRLPVARAGLCELVLSLGVAVFVTLLVIFLHSISPWWSVIPIGFGAFVLYFFRDPDRTIPAEAGVVVSPADGKIVHISEIENPEFIGEPAVRIGIFLSVFNVHVNRMGLAGQLIRLRYQPGKFINALFESSAEENERMELLFVEPAPPHRKFMIRQIAGAIARRIVCEIRPGQSLELGQRFGMIKFGSRTEIFLPREGLKLYVKVGEKVRGGATRLGRYAPAHSEVRTCGQTE